MEISNTFTILLVLTLITVNKGQNFDFQGLQALFQPYQQYNVNPHERVPRPPINRHENRKKPNEYHQYDYVFASEEKPVKKPNSSQTNNSRSINKNNRFNNQYESTTRLNRIKTTTPSYYNNNRATNNNNNHRAATNNNNHNNGLLNTDYNPESYFNNNAQVYDRQPNFNGVIPKNNRGHFESSSFVYPSEYNENPLLNPPGVRPGPSTSLPPFTNKPLTNNFWDSNRPLESSSGRYGDQDPQPEILIGPDEDDMTKTEKRGVLALAERMCDRYKALTVKKVVALPLALTPDPVVVNVSDCVPIKVPLVIGGTAVTIGDFPHMALVGWQKTRKTGYSWKCGASLISDQYLLTAGHCTYQDKDYDAVSGPPQAVQLGSSYYDDPGALVMKIAAVVRHPKYKQMRRYHDAALIKMIEKVTFSEVIRPACLGVPPPEGSSVIATGWGRTEFGGDYSSQLLSVSLNVWNMEECKEIWGTSRTLPIGVTPESHMCAGKRAGGKDTCQGDSGGPAQIAEGCAWRVVAVTSYGRACGAPNTPALYATIPRVFVAAQLFGYT